MLRATKRLLRSPRMIVGELAAIAVAATLGAALPQAGVATDAELARLHDSGPITAALVKKFALDHVFRSGWFLALTALAAASLSIVIVEQLRRVRAGWSARLIPAHFNSAPLRAEFERPAPGRAAAEEPQRRAGVSPAWAAGSMDGGHGVHQGHAGGDAGATIPHVTIWTRNRLGLLGSPLFHVGLLCVMLAGALRALFGTEAAVDLLEGQMLAPTAQAWAAQWPGVLAQPFRLDLPVTLRSVRATRYESGELQNLKMGLTVQDSAGPRETEIAVNHDSRAAGGRVFLTSDFGPAALIEWQPVGALPVREAVQLRSLGKGSFEAAASGPGGERAHLRAQLDAAGNPPQLVEVRVMKDGALLYTGEAQAGETLSLPGGMKLALHGTPFWARLRGSRDASLWLAYAGFALVMAGAVIIFGIVKLDGCLVVTPLGDRERVFVALKPQRFAPLFQERFEQLVAELKVPAPAEAPQVRGVGLPTCGVAGFQVGAAAPNERRAGLETRDTAGLEACATLRLTSWLLLLGLAFASAGCQRTSVEQARRLVERYNKVVAEAYRRGDVKLIDPVVGPNEGRKLTGLIGVRLDAGLTLDSELLALEIVGVEQADDTLRVQTKERWKYRDRKIGSGAQVGEESLDAYEMLYVFKRIDKAWLVDEIRFTTTPQVGRKQTPFPMERPSVAHGLTADAPTQEAKP